MPYVHGLSIGDRLSNDELVKTFTCGVSGGMRRSKASNSLLIIADHTKALYEDRWENNVFHYTGMGKIGDQSLDYMQNKTLNDSNSNGVDLFLFEVYVENQYMFMGQVRLAGEPYQENQLDDNSDLRLVWVFPLKLVGQKSPIVVPQTDLTRKQEYRDKLAAKMSDETLKKRATHAKKKATTRRTTTNSYDRDPYVSEYTKRRAKGICQLCNTQAPFVDKKHQPFLETHHIIWLSRGGEDSIDNTAALCPNCHRKMHALDLKSDIAILEQAAKQR